MKLMQQDSEFSPIAIVMESRDEVYALWDLIRLACQHAPNVEMHALAIRISNYLSNEAKL